MPCHASHGTAQRVQRPTCARVAEPNLIGSQAGPRSAADPNACTRTNATMTDWALLACRPPCMHACMHASP
eukprot:356003-Chlamydomonas_euryale.AAC.5